MQEINMKKDGYARVLKYTGVFGGVQGLSMIATIVRNKFAAMFLGPAGLGLVSVYNTTITLISNATNFGIPFSAVRNISALYDEDESAKDKISEFVEVVRNWSVLTAILGVLFCCCCSYYLSEWTFGNSDYTLAFILLSPILGLMAISSGELAILKSIRRLQPVALISLYCAVGSLFVTIPLYYFVGVNGIIPSLILLALLTMGITLFYSCKYYHFHISLFSVDSLKKGIPMIKLGVAFILAGIFGSGVEYIIRSYLLNVDSLDCVGLYNAGYSITVTYAGLLFTAMGTDYFPRLSSICKDVDKMNFTVNQQMEISVILASPLLVLFILVMPILLPLLYADTFLPVINMAKCAAFSIYFKAMILPIAYISLARGDSKSYLLLELIGDICVVLLIIIGFRYWGLLGTGVAISVAYLLELFLVYTYTHFHYRFRLSMSVFKVFLIQLPSGILAFILSFCLRGILYWLLGIICIAISAFISLRILQKRTNLLDVFKMKINSLLKKKK